MHCLTSQMLNYEQKSMLEPVANLPPRHFQQRCNYPWPCFPFNQGLSVKVQTDSHSGWNTETVQTSLGTVSHPQAFLYLISISLVFFNEGLNFLILSTHVVLHILEYLMIWAEKYPQFFFSWFYCSVNDTVIVLLLICFDQC